MQVDSRRSKKIVGNGDGDIKPGSFSPPTSEPAGQKETCAWFVKGNCKFGHKCALAHVLPGQSMAMDRNNKNAARGSGSERSGENSRAGEVNARRFDDGNSYWISLSSRIENQALRNFSMILKHMQTYKLTFLDPRK